MNTGDCSTVTPGKPLDARQKHGLELITQLHGGRDVILAIDLTGSVDFSARGRILLRQMIEKSLQSGDSVYIIPFASEVNPLSNKSNPFSNPIVFNGKKDIEKVLNAIPWESNPNLRNTDIQQAELSIYQGVARLNQCRLTKDNPIKPQSVVWITDAPLLTNPGITSLIWKETPKNSPFRLANSPESIARKDWLNALPINLRQQQITTNNNKSYQFSVVDIPPTVQEFCNLESFGKEHCLVNQYLFGQLWLPVLLIVLGSIVAVLSAFFGIIHWKSLRTPWKLEVKFNSDQEQEKQRYRLNNHGRIALGGDGIGSIYCPGAEIRGYLKRQGNQLYLEPTRGDPIYLRGREITQKIKIYNDLFTINCREQSQNKDFEIVIQIIRK